MSWLRSSDQPNSVNAEDRRALEEWVRLRFQLATSDGMVAIIGAVSRLTDAGISVDDALDTVLRVLREPERAAVTDLASGSSLHPL